MEMVKAVSLTKKFDRFPAVNEISFSVAEGEIYGLVGPDGAGKTTTLRLLASILEPTSGEAYVNGLDIVREAEEVKQHIGYMSQRFDLYPDLSVMENINFYADIYGVPRKERKDKIHRLLSFSNLEPFKKRFAGNLSGGMKQKLGLACSLIHTPKVLFLDEPTNGVDPVSRRDFWRILYQLLKDEVTIIISTAYLDEAERCNRWVLMHKGQIAAGGTPQELKDLIKGDILEIRTPAPRHAVDVLRRETDLEMVELFGERVHLLAKEREATESQARLILEGEDIAVEDMRRVEPSLEDVLVGLLAKEEKK
jgi:ABC-2 type transport system ATP-binding protein